MVLQASRLRRRPPRGAAVENFALDVRAGETVALLGDAGCGSATLLRLLAGDEAPDAGEIRVATAAGGPLAPVRPATRSAAIGAGLALVDPGSLAPGLTGLDNILLGAESFWRPWQERRAARARAHEHQHRLDLAVALDVAVARLSGGDRLRIALLRALDRTPRVIMFEEPTAGLSTQETAHLFAVLRHLSEESVAVLLATRNPAVAIAASGRIVVVRGGTKATDVAARGCDAPSLAALMTGRRMEPLAVQLAIPGRPVLELARVAAGTPDERHKLRGISLTVREREIVGIACVPGNGEATLMGLFAGLTAPSAGRLKLYGRTPRRLDPALLVRVGLARIPADCRTYGLVPGLSVRENLVLEDIHAADLSRRGLLNAEAVGALADRLFADSGISSAAAHDGAERLSDADARSLVLTRGLDRGPPLIIADHPTRDLDLASRRAVQLRLLDERDRGSGILLISGDVEELMTLADQIGVLYEGRLSIPQPTAALDRRTLGLMMGGDASLAQDWRGWEEAT